MRPGARLGVALLLGILHAAASTAPAAAQQGERAGPPLLAALSAGFSLRDTPRGLRLGEDIRSAALRLQWARSGLQPWLEVGAFERPDLDCTDLGDAPCNLDGWTARLGAAAPLYARADEPGLRGELVAGVGAGFSEETELGYVLGIEVAWAGAVVLPILAFRWERFPGLTNVTMLTVGLRLEPFR